MALANITNNILTDTGVNVSSLTPTSTTISTTAPLQGGGDLSANRTLSITQSGTSANGFLSSTDWNTFNNKQAAGNYMTSLTGEATGTGPGATAVTLNNASVTAKVLTGVNITGGTVVATDSILTAFGKLQNQINGLIGSSVYQGTWNAATNTPALASGVGTRGYYYIVAVAGTTNLDGITDWFIGDWAIFDGTAWQQVDNTDAVVSVNGQTGAVSLTTDNIAEGATNQYFLNSRARAALSFTAGSGAYNSTTGVITIPTNTSQLTNGANFITLASLSGTAPIQYNNTTGAISITQAGAASNGFLSSTDWNTFNNKQSALTNPVTGTGTTNYLPKFTGTSTIGNSQIFDNGTNVGIGTATPNYLLQVGNASSGFTSVVTIGANSTSASTTNLLLQNISSSETTGTGVNINFSGVANWLGRINSQFVGGTGTGNANMSFWTPSGGSLFQRMTLDFSGNLGLGVTPSAWSLGKVIQVGSTTSVFNDANGSTYFGNNFNYNSNFLYLTSSYATSYVQQVDGKHVWNIAPSGTGGNAISFTQAMTLNASGNLMLGTTSISNPISFIRLLNISGGDAALVLSNSNGTAKNWSLGALDNGSFSIYDGSTFRFSIASTGAATFSSSVTIQGGNALFVNNAANTRSGSFYTSVDGTEISSFNGAGEPLLLKSPVGYISMFTNGSERMRITSGGNVLIGTSSDLGLTTGGILQVNNAYGMSITNGGQALRLFRSGVNTWEFGQGTFTSQTGFGLTDATASKTALFIQQTTCNVGIGTTSPGARLDLGSSYGSPKLYLYNDGTYVNGFGIYANEFRNFFDTIDAAASRMTWGKQTGGGTFTEFMRLTKDGNVGIGTTSPQNVLDLGAASNGNGLTWSNYSNLFSEYSSGALWMSSNFYGNIGSGGYKTSLTATFGAAAIKVSGTSGSGNSGLLQFYVDDATSKTAGASFTPTERMRITSGGNVGINTTNPAAGVQIEKYGSKFDGDVQYNQPSGNVFLSVTGSVANQDNWFGIRGNYGSSSGSSNLLLQANYRDVNSQAGHYISSKATALGVADFIIGKLVTSTSVSTPPTLVPQLYITSGGNLLIGTTTDSGYKMEVAGSTRISSSGGVELSLRSASSNPQYISFSEAGVADRWVFGVAGGSGDLQFRSGATNISNGTERMRITSGGDVLVNATATTQGAKFYVNGIGAFGSVYVGALGTGTVYSNAGFLTNTNPSDRRLKTNIIPLTYGLADILKLNPVSYNWKDGSNGKQFGFIAQEVQDVMPDAVKNGEYLGLEKDAIYSALVNAIKEQQSQINELKSQIK